MQQRKRPRRRKTKCDSKSRVLSGVKVEHLGSRGDGMCLVDGDPLYVPLSAPGDRLTVQIAGGRGEIISLDEVGSNRVEPPCPYFGACGGCSLQHLSDEFVEEWKLDMLVQTLAQRELPADNIASVIRVPDGMRRRATFAFHVTPSRFELGFSRRRSHQVIGIDHCMLLTPAINESIASISELLSTCFEQGTKGRVLVTECKNSIVLDIEITGSAGNIDDHSRLSDLTRHAANHSFGRVTLNGELVFQREPPILDCDDIDVGFPIGGFLQPSSSGEAALRSIVAREISKNIKPKGRVVDLFSGAGALSLPLARTYRLSAIDNSATAIEAMSEAAKQLEGLNPISTEVRDLDERPVMTSELKDVAAVILDPPRAGASMQVTQLAESQVPLIVYVSCNVSTFARDCRRLVDAGYALSEVTPVDQFQYTPHLECVGLLKLRS